MLADRMKEIEGSGVRKMFELIATMEDPINLSIGQAHYDAPDEMKEAAILAIRSGQNRYTVTDGLAEFNAKTLDKLTAQFGHRPIACIMTSGVSGALFLCSLALLNPGDEVLLPDPYFVMYKNLLAIVGARPRFYNTYPKEGNFAAGWRPDIDEIGALANERTKMILLNSPCNPTGGVLTDEELDHITAIAKANDAWILSDEIYSHFVYDRPFASMIPRMRGFENIIVTGGFSKIYAVPGWRLGWAVGPEEVIDAMKILQQYTFVCAPAPLQSGGMAALDLDVQHRVDEYRGKRDMVHEALKDAFTLVASEGSFYAFPAYPEGITEQDFMNACIERKVLIVPGSAFSRKATNFRLSFAASDETLERGLGILNEIARTK